MYQLKIDAWHDLTPSTNSQSSTICEAFKPTSRELKQKHTQPKCYNGKDLKDQPYTMIVKEWKKT